MRTAKSKWLHCSWSFMKNIAMVCIGIFIGLALGAVLVSYANPRAPKVAEIVRAREFELVDAKGTSRAVLGISTRNNAYLRLNDEKGNLKAILDNTPEHEETVPVIPSGLGTTIPVSETTSLRMYDSQGRQRVVLEAEGGKTGKEGEEAPGKSCLVLTNPSGKMNATLSTAAPGEARLEFGHDTFRGFNDAFNVFHYVILSGSVKKGAALDLLAGGGDFTVEERPQEEALIQLRDKHGKATVTTQKQGNGSH